MEKFLYYILFPLTLLALSSCDKTDEPLPVPSTVHRTVIVYMVADNSLGAWGCDNADISEMVTAASSGALAGGRLIVYRSAVVRPMTILRFLSTSPGRESTLSNVIRYLMPTTSVYTRSIHRVYAKC